MEVAAIEENKLDTGLESRKARCFLEFETFSQVGDRKKRENQSDSSSSNNEINIQEIDSGGMVAELESTDFAKI
jgi:hypothetical protein